MTISLRCSIDPAAPDAVLTELLVLGPSLGTTSALWDSTLTALRASERGRQLRVLRWDLPGHGASPVANEAFSIADLADAVIALVDDTGGGRFHYVGISHSGTVGIELALRYPDRLLTLGLVATGSAIGTPAGWAERAAQVRAQGTASLVTGSTERWFTPETLTSRAADVSATLARLTEVDDESYALAAEALAGFDRSEDLASISVPTFTVSGETDTTTTPESMAALADAIPGAVAFKLDGASHLVPIGQPEALAAILSGRVSAGLATRRTVLGDEHVDRSIGRTSPETAIFQDFITRYAWGDVWSRPGLSHRDRSIATLASLVTGGHDHEVRLHIRAALRNGLSRDEIAEVLLHTAIYAGLPPVNAAFAIMQEVFAEIDEEADNHG